MALKTVKYDTATGTFQTAADPTAATWTDQNYDVGGGGQVNFTVSAVFDGTTKIDVWVNGVKNREGATNDFQRNTSLNRIEFNFTVPQNAWVLIRVF